MASKGPSSREVARITLVVILVLSVAVVVALAALNARGVLLWVVTAIFVALALNPYVLLIERIRIGERHPPRWAAVVLSLVGFVGLVICLALVVGPPIVSDIERLGAKVPRYVQDFEKWAQQNPQFAALDSKLGITDNLKGQASNLPSTIGSGAAAVGDFTLGLVKHVLAAITILALAFLLLVDRGRIYRELTDRMTAKPRAAARRIGERISEIVRAYVTATLLLAFVAAFLTWLFLTVAGFHLALPLALLVLILDLIPLVGLTIAGILVALALGIDALDGVLVAWVILFIAYQQLQDRVLQPILYSGGALKINPAVAIVSVLIGASLAGILGALLAIPIAASLGAILDEVFPRKVKPPAKRASSAKASG